jgi:hypothetical protein
MPLGAAPAFDLAFDRDAVDNALEMLRPNKNDGTP